MKKIIGLILALCLVFTLCANAFADSKPTITQQPETSTTSKKGSVSFSIKVKGTVSSYTWYFINPATGEKVSGRKLNTVVKGVKVSNPNSKKITLSKVPESMHGWLVYCHINGNGYKIDSDQVMLLVYGMEAPESAASAQTDEQAQEGAETAEAQPETEPKAQPETQTEAEPETQAETQPEGEAQAQDGTDEEIYDGQPDAVTVSASAKVLYKLDSSGSKAEEAPVSKLEFTGSCDILVQSDEPIVSWTINGVRIQPAEPVTEFKLIGVSSNVSMDLKINKASAADAQVDESKLCHVVCEGCTFTYMPYKLLSVTEGDVPSGAPIRISANTGDGADAGYSINGGEPEGQGAANYQFTVTEDVKIVSK